MGVFDKNSSAGLREKYNHAIQTAKSLRMQGGAEERDGKLHFNGHPFVEHFKFGMPVGPFGEKGDEPWLRATLFVPSWGRK